MAPHAKKDSNADPKAQSVESVDALRSRIEEWSSRKVSDVLPLVLDSLFRAGGFDPSGIQSSMDEVAQKLDTVPKVVKSGTNEVVRALSAVNDPVIEKIKAIAEENDKRSGLTNEKIFKAMGSICKQMASVESAMSALSTKQENEGQERIRHLEAQVDAMAAQVEAMTAQMAQSERTLTRLTAGITACEQVLKRALSRPESPLLDPGTGDAPDGPVRSIHGQGPHSVEKLLDLSMSLADKHRNVQEDTVRAEQTLEDLDHRLRAIVFQEDSLRDHELDLDQVIQIIEEKLRKFKMLESRKRRPTLQSPPWSPIDPEHIS